MSFTFGSGSNSSLGNTTTPTKLARDFENLSFGSQPNTTPALSPPGTAASKPNSPAFEPGVFNNPTTSSLPFGGFGTPAASVTTTTPTLFGTTSTDFDNPQTITATPFGEFGDLFSTEDEALDQYMATKWNELKCLFSTQITQQLQAQQQQQLLLNTDEAYDQSILNTFDGERILILKYSYLLDMYESGKMVLYKFFGAIVEYYRRIRLKLQLLPHSENLNVSFPHNKYNN